MPNMKLFGNQIKTLMNDLQRALQKYYEEDRGWGFAKTRFYRLMAGISMANDPAYANLDKLPEGMDDDAIREELNKRQEKLANDALVQRAAESMDIIACRMKSQWKEPDVPEMRDVDAIQENFDLIMKRELKKVEEFEPMYQGMHGKKMAGPNMTAFGATLVRESKKLEEETLPTLNVNRTLSENEMDKVSEQLIQWLANVQMATDPKYRDLKESPDFKEMDNMRKETEAFKSRNRAPYKSLFKRQKTVLHIFCGDSSRWEKGKPKLLPYFKVQESLQTRLVEIEDDMFTARLNEHFKTALQSQGEKRSRAIANIIALNNRYEESRKKGKDIDIFDEHEIRATVDRKLAVESFLAVTGGDQLDEFLKTRDVKGLGQALTHKQFEFTKAKEAEKKRAEDEERKRKEEEEKREERAYAREERAERQRENALSDKEVAGLRMDQLAEKLRYELWEFDSLIEKDYGDDSENLLKDAIEARAHFADCPESDNPEEKFKKGVEAMNRFLKTKLPNSDKSIAKYGQEEVLIADNFNKLMRRTRVVIDKEMQQQTAAKWIEDFKKEFRDHPEQVRNEPGYPKARIAWIMAARELSNSTRGKASTLNKVISEVEIKARAAKIMENEEFNKFTDELSEGEDLRKVEAVFTKRFSHGGELDDMFRAHLASRPAGDLENDPKLKRWMPTVRQRIEWLQKDAARLENPYNHAAEILMLRQSAEVQRGGKGLDAPIPVQGERNGKKVPSLSDSVESYAQNKDFQAAIDKPDIKKQIVAGHGGAMVERLNQQREAQKLQEQEGPGLNK